LANFGEILPCVRETTNLHDPFAVAVLHERRIVGHLPREISALCALFIERRGRITCQVNGRRQYSRDLPQGGLEIPCVLTFSGEEKEVQKVKQLIDEIKAISIVKCHSISDPVEFKESEKKKLKAVPSNGAKMDPRCDQESGHEMRSNANLVVIADDAEVMATNDLEWISVFNISLKQSDREAICNGHRLNDIHINAAQRILANQFPSFVGLDSTLKQRRIGKWVNNYIQIFFCRGCHWITASTVGCREGVINIFDSLFGDVDDGLKRVISEIFSDHTLTFKVADVPVQSGVDDCGLFAVAFATALAFTQDPLNPMSFKQDEMRTHLIECLQDKYFVDFA